VQRTYPIDIPYEALAEFCRTNHIRKLSLFGSVIRDDFTSESDIDVLVEFEEGRTPGFRYFGIQEELGMLLGRRVDLLTPAGLSKYFRNKVLEQAEGIYDAA
jgi:predicted nucleotidyltransferase